MHDPQTPSRRRAAPDETTVRADLRFVLMCAAVVAMAFLGSIADVRYLNPDDRWYAAWVWSGSWLQIAYDIAVEHGRLLKPSSYTYFFPYLFDSPLYQDALRLGTTLATCLIGGCVLARLLRMRELTLLYALVFFALAQNSANLNLFVNYPFAWEFTWATWLLGTLGLIVALDRQAMRYAVAGTLVMLIGLQEGFIPYAFTLPLIVLARRSTARPAWRYLVPYAVGIALWLVCWAAWRVQHPSSYDGSSMGGIAHPLLALRTIVTLSLGGVPLATVFNGEVALTLHSLREHVTALWFIKMLAVGAATMVLARLVDARTARVSFPRIPPDVSGLELLLGRGFYGWHFVGDGRWSWAEAQAQILIRNDARPLIESTGDALAEHSFEWGSFWDVELELDLWAPSEQTITFLDGEGKELDGVRLSPGRLSTHGVLLRIERTSASSTIVLRSDHPAQGEAQATVFQVHGMRLRKPLAERNFER